MAKDKRMHPLLGQVESNERPSRRRPRTLDDGEQGLSAELAALHDRDELGLLMQPPEPGAMFEEPARKGVPTAGYREAGMASYCERCGGIGGHVPGCPAEGAQAAPEAAYGTETEPPRPTLRALLGRVLRGLAARIEGAGDDDAL